MCSLLAKKVLSTIMSCCCVKGVYNLTFSQTLTFSVSERQSFEYVIMTFSAMAYSVTCVSPEPVLFSSHSLQVAVIIFGALKWVTNFLGLVLRCFCDLEKQLTFLRDFKKHDNSLQPGHISCELGHCLLETDKSNWLIL